MIPEGGYPPTLSVGQVLIARDAITISRPTLSEDAHGWVSGDSEDLVEIKTVRGSMQWSMPPSENSMTSDGHGAFAPALTAHGIAYLPADSGVQAGDVLVTGNGPRMVVRSWVLMRDPRPSGEIDHIQCMVEEVVGV